MATGAGDEIGKTSAAFGQGSSTRLSTHVGADHASALHALGSGGGTGSWEVRIWSGIVEKWL